MTDRLRVLSYPLDALRTVPVIHDAVETLTRSIIWTCVDDPAAGASASKEGRRVSENEEIRQALWIYHLHCVLFRPPHDSIFGDIEGETPLIRAQRYYFFRVDKNSTCELVQRLGGVCQDISDFLVKLYGKNWAMRFETVYEDHSERLLILSEGKSLSRRYCFDQRPPCFGRDYSSSHY